MDNATPPPREEFSGLLQLALAHLLLRASPTKFGTNAQHATAVRAACLMAPLRRTVTADCLLLFAL